MLCLLSELIILNAAVNLAVQSGFPNRLRFLLPPYLPMITNSVATSYRSRRSAVLFFVVGCHFFVAVFFIRSVQLTNTIPSQLVMSVFSVRQDATGKLKTPFKKIDAEIVRQSGEPKSSTLKTVVDESKILTEAINSEQASTEKATDEGRAISSKELAALDSLARRYNLDMPKIPLAETLTTTLTPAQQAAQDPRTNTPRLTKSEKFAVALGSLDCIFQTRLANGEIIRVPGTWVEIPARSEPGRVSLRKVRFCVRAHQAEGEEGSDLTAILAGLRGK